MNTFLPYKNFTKSAQCLDYKRLGKQRVEAWQIYIALTQPNYGWKNHPIIKMWKDFKIALLHYGLVVCEEWIERGYKDNMKDRFLSAMWKERYKGERYKAPFWLGNKKFHASHRSNLLRKDKKYYSQFGWKEKDNLPYVWVT